MMQLHFVRPSPAQRLVLQQRLARLQDPSVALALLRQHLPLRTLPVQAVCTPQRIAPDRFVLRVETRTAAGTRAAYAFKSYADDRGRRIMAVSQALAAWWQQRQEPCVVCVPAAYVPDEDLLISPWVAGRPADAGHFLAQVHRWCLSHPTLTARTPQVLAQFRAAYRALMPTVSARNISFYYGLTLIRKIYTMCRLQPPGWPQLLAAMTHAARAALENVGLQENCTCTP